MRIAAEDDALGFVEQDDQAEAEQDLGEVIGSAQAREQQALDDRAEREAGDDPDRQGQPEAAEVLDHGKGDIGADHVEDAVGEIDHAHDAEQQGQSAGDEIEDEPVLDGIEELNEKEEHPTWIPPP